MSGSVNQHRTFEVLTAEPVRSRRKPRHWSDEEKAQLVADTFAPGANVSAMYAASPPHGFFGCSDLTAISVIK